MPVARQARNAAQPHKGGGWGGPSPNLAEASYPSLLIPLGRNVCNETYVTGMTGIFEVGACICVHDLPDRITAGRDGWQQAARHSPAGEVPLEP
jgi:hypothetical protein